MSTSIEEPTQLEKIYASRFGPGELDYRQQIWRALIDGFFQTMVPADSTVLNLGCGYGEFINQIACGKNLGWI